MTPASSGHESVSSAAGHGRAPDDWQPVARLCLSVRADLPRLAPGIVDQTRRELPDFRMMDRDEQERGLIEQADALLSGLAARRPPSHDEIKQARALGDRRASSGLPLQALIGAYHVGYREIWNLLLIRAEAQDERLATQLVRLVGAVWTWVQQASSAAADAYGEAVRAQDAAQLSLTYRFLEALQTGSPDADAVRLARALGFDPAGQFQAVCSPATWSDDQVNQFRRDMRRHRGIMRCANRETFMIALIQNMSASPLIAAVRERDREVPVGVGLARTGLDGAVASIADAQEVLPLANATTSTVFFDQQWLVATLLPRVGRLAALLEHCREPARTHPELVETVRAFAQNGLSLTATGRAMHLYPNTVRHRLRRWEELTGWNARTWEGLAASMLGLGLFGVEAAGNGTVSD